MRFFSRGPVSTEQYLLSRRVRKDSFVVHVVPDQKIQILDDYLERQGIDKTPWTAEEAKTAELKHRLTARAVILWTLVIPMSIAPFWLMALLSLPAFNVKEAYSEKMQAAFLTALVSDFIGLYYVITRDLFPKGQVADEKRQKLANNEQREEN